MTAKGMALTGRTGSAGMDAVYRGDDGVELAVRDHGGDGPPLLLLHGAGRTLLDWERVAPLLAVRHRVWAMDLRGHGRSGDGAAPWSCEVAVEDVRAVLAACGAPEAVVVGHSLGGMVAARCLERDERDGGAPAAVNLDGHWFGRPEQYPGLDPEYVRERLAEVRELTREAGGRTFDAEALDGVLGFQAAMAEALGIPAELMAAGVRRSLGETDNGRLFLRPARDRALQVQEELAGLDLFALYRRVTRPLLIARALRPNPSMPGMPPWFDALMAAYARGLARDLDALARTRPHVTVAEVEGTHAMVLERPEEIAGLVTGFVAGALPGGTSQG
ncbi:alpha/beta fold hydrolase [Streptomyces sp. C184]|uniref:alpha/beta fold hydrolase n=1 Tax=Streptomyces sp. C184 TaxID=3237121 RepID=UPI0034C69E9A